MTPSRPSARELIGGRWSVSLRVWLVLSAFLVGSVIPSGAGLGWPPGTMALALVGQFVFCGALVLITGLTVFRRRAQAPMPVAAVVALGAGIGVVRVAVMVWVATLTDSSLFTDSSSLLLGGISLVATSALVYPTLVYLFAARDAYTTERARLIALDVRLSEERLRAAGALDATFDATLAAIELRLREARAASVQLIAEDEPDPTAVAASLLATARTGMRPLSHELWQPTGAVYPRVRWGQLAASETRRKPLPILVPTVVFTVFVALGSAPLLGSLRSGVVLLTGIVSINLCFRIGRVCIRRSRSLALPLVVATILVTVLPIVAVAIALGALPERVALLFLFLPGVVIFASAVSALREAGDEVVLDLAQRVEAKEIEQMALYAANDRLRRDVAAHLHGTVQTDLISAGLALQQAVGSRDSAAMQAATAAAIAALELQYDPHRTVAGQSVIDLIANADRRWAGILALTWEIDDTEVPLAVVPTIATLLSEALTNAVVHGAASRVVIRIASCDGTLELLVTDDGSGPGAGPPGLGSALFDDTTAQRWELVAGPTGGATMRATVQG
jgi:signal transduction histidine kinase